MRRPHPYLAISLACAAVVLVTLSALACPAAAQRVPPTPITTVWVINGSPVMPGSVECQPRGTGLYVPTLARARQIRDAVRLTVVMDIETGALTISRTYQEWRVFTALDWPTTFTARPTWVMAAVPPGYSSNCVNDQGQPRWCGCAAGVGSLPAVVDTSDNVRVEALVAWETANGLLGFLNRPDLWDGPVVSGIVNRAATLCGGWRFQ